MGCKRRGINIDLGLGIAVDSSGASYITGEFYSPPSLSAE